MSPAPLLPPAAAMPDLPDDLDLGVTFASTVMLFVMGVAVGVTGTLLICWRCIA